ncbi:MAG: exodeoxyribonuclease VII small subunit [Spirochaetota bacterium]|nr:exodeoxyribonuclease VII small subunit [Spirochaetota bacterium]
MEFESAMARLTDIVSRLEAADLSLEDSIKLYEEGMKLHKVCQDSLSKAERRVYILKSGGGESQSDTPHEENPSPDEDESLRKNFDLFDSP